MVSSSDLHLTLASGSPRRIDLLVLTAWSFTAVRSMAEEIAQDGEAPEAATIRLARQKACEVAERAGETLVLAADTLVVHQGRPLGKPASRQEALDMLIALRGQQHHVVTSISLMDAASDREATETCVSRVPMRFYQDKEVRGYVASSSPMDKAGAYGIQDRSFGPVDLSHMEDCYANVMGLPLCHVVRGMRKLGHEPEADVPLACRAFTGYDCQVYHQILAPDP